MPFFGRQSRKNAHNHGSDAPQFILTSHRFLLRFLFAIVAVTLVTNYSFHDALDSSLSVAHKALLGSTGGSQFPEQKTSKKKLFNATGPPPKHHSAHMTEEEGKKYILSIMNAAGALDGDDDGKMAAELPSWHQVQAVVGDRPRIYGLETCRRFQDQVPALDRMIGAAGMFNSGTNLLTKLVKQNCRIPERFEAYGPRAPTEAYGMRWQVPWGKHTPVRYRSAHLTETAAKRNILPEHVLPVVTIRDPYTWMKSMCKNGYSARWPHRGLVNCPHIVNQDLSRNPVTVTYKKDERVLIHDSVADLWNDWYNEYIVHNHEKFPFLVVRMEDLVFYTEETITAVCECAGGEIRKDRPFSYIVASAKSDSKGHDVSTGIVEAWIKYSKMPEPQAGFSDEDFAASKSILDKELMEIFGYRHPPSYR